mgnify:CR=1 FL=1|jgi:hypothetical protein|tara:strand:+ start:161 stop:523 length:363 start_codon:yes stop_codon:yes gene_type:complete
MATLTAKLTLTSANATTDSLNLNVSETLTVGEPAVNVSRVSVLHSAATDILVAANAVTTYVYIKNMDPTNLVKLSTGAAELFGILWPNQWMFINILDAEGLKAQANNATCIVEYGYWTKA